MQNPGIGQVVKAVYQSVPSLPYVFSGSLAGLAGWTGYDRLTRVPQRGHSPSERSSNRELALWSPFVSITSQWGVDSCLWARHNQRTEGAPRLTAETMDIAIKCDRSLTGLCALLYCNFAVQQLGNRPATVHTGLSAETSNLAKQANGIYHLVTPILCICRSQPKDAESVKMLPQGTTQPAKKVESSRVSTVIAQFPYFLVTTFQPGTQSGGWPLPKFYPGLRLK